MKQTIGILLISIILSTTTLGASRLAPVSFSSFDRQQKNLFDTAAYSSFVHRFFMPHQQNTNFLKPFVFNPEHISLQDDAFQESDTLHHTEWWYFDALLNSGYSIQLLFQIISLLNQEVMVVRINIYQHSEIVTSAEQWYFPVEYTVSTEKPLITLQEKPAMTSSSREDKWIYDVELDIEDVAVALCFVSSTMGWKGEVPFGKWIVSQPKAEVTGTITIHDKTIEVFGSGYHDHNAGLTIQARFKYLGWYWGKVTTKTVTAIWAVLFQRTLTTEPLLVISSGAETFRSIEPEEIQFQVANFSFENGRFIPRTFIIRASSQNLLLDLTMSTVSLDYKNVGPLQYWRYHVHCKGHIVVDSRVEIIDEIQINEFFRFL